RVDDKALPAGHLDHDIGTQPAAIAAGHADLGLEIGMFGQAAAFEHIAQLLLAPAPARLGSVTQRVDELRRLARYAFGALAHRRDLPLKQTKGIAPVCL